jgi:hypothetical protein
LTAKLTGQFLLLVPHFPARCISLRRRGGFCRYKLDLPKLGSYNKPSGCSTSGDTSHWGLVEEREEEEEEEEEKR